MVAIPTNNSPDIIVELVPRKSFISANALPTSLMLTPNMLADTAVWFILSLIALASFLETPYPLANAVILLFAFNKALTNANTPVTNKPIGFILIALKAAIIDP